MPWFICDYRDWEIKANLVEDTWEVMILDKQGQQVRLYRPQEATDEQVAFARGEQIFRNEERSATEAGKPFP